MRMIDPKRTEKDDRAIQRGRTRVSTGLSSPGSWITSDHSLRLPCKRVSEHLRYRSASTEGSSCKRQIRDPDGKLVNLEHGRLRNRRYRVLDNLPEEDEELIEHFEPNLVDPLPSPKAWQVGRSKHRTADSEGASADPAGSSSAASARADDAVIRLQRHARPDVSLPGTRGRMDPDCDTQPVSTSNSPAHGASRQTP